VSPGVSTGLKQGWDLVGGGGFAVTPWLHHRDWRLYLTANYIFEHAGVNQSSVSKARFYAATFDPTFRFYSKSRVSGYFLGGAGWLRRSIDYAGQPVPLAAGTPAILAPGANSGAADVGAGINVRVAGPNSPMAFVEARYVRGLAINHTTTLVPISVGIRW
jgi:hypothetical protein